MIFGLTLTVLAGTFTAGALLLGRYTMVVVGGALVVSGLVALQRGYFDTALCGLMVASGAGMLLIGRPSWLRAGHRARTTRAEALE